MSLILDALKRSEQERANSQNNPAVNMEINGRINKQKSRFPWTVFFAVLLLLSLGFLTYLLLDEPMEPPVSQSHEISTTMNTVAVNTPVNTADEVAVKETVKPAPRPLSPPPILIQNKQPPPVPLTQQQAKKPVIEKQSITQVQPLASQKKTEVAPDPVYKEPVSVEPDISPKDPEPASDTPSLSELPDNDQMMFLNYEINTHFYSSKPGRSFALINMKKYREGQYLDGRKLKIEKITADGVVVNYGRGSVLLRSY